MESGNSRGEAAEVQLRRICPDWFAASLSIDIPDGWSHLIVRLCRDIASELATDATSFRIVQIKQKFAGLRFVYKAPDDDAWQRIAPLISKAEVQAARTCEICGSPGERSVDARGWHATLCETDRAQHRYELVGRF